MGTNVIHNHEVRSSILRPATRKHSTSLCFFSFIGGKLLPKGAGVDTTDAESFEELEEDSEFYLVFSNFPQRASFNLMK